MTLRTPAPLRTMPTVVRTILLAGLLAFLPGCSPQASELSADSAAALSSRLATVRAAAAASDPDGALRELERLEEHVKGEAANGGMTFARFQSIKSALDLVRTDLQALAQAAADERTAEAAKQEAAPATQPAPAAPAPAIAPYVADPTPADATPDEPAPAVPGHAPGQGNGKAKSGEAAQKGKGP